MSQADIAELKKQVQFLDWLKMNKQELYQDLYKERLIDFHKIVSRITSKSDLYN